MPRDDAAQKAALSTCQPDGFEQAERVRRALMDSTADCVKIISLDGKVVLVNPSGYRLLETSDERQLENRPWLDFWKGEHRAAAEAAFVLAEQGGVGRFQGFCPTFTGKPRWWDVVVHPMRDSGGHVEQLLCVSRDITELKLAQLSQASEREILEQFASGTSVERILESITNLVEKENPGLQAAVVSWDPVAQQAKGRTALVRGLLHTLTAERLAHPSPELDHEEWTPLIRHLRAAGLRCCDIALLTDKDECPRGLLLVTCPWDVQAKINPTARTSWVGLARLALKHSRHQETLSSNQARFAALAKVSPVGIFQADSHGARSFVNERWKEITGLTDEEAMGTGWSKAIHPEDREAVLDNWRTAIATATDFRAEYRLQDGKGNVTWVIGEATAAGEQGFIGTITDITDLRRVHDALVESSARFELLANNMSQFCWMANERGELFWYNQRWFEYTGTVLEDMQGWGWKAVHHPDYVEGVLESYSRCVETGEDWEDTFPLRSKTGEYRWFLSRANPIRDASGRVIRWFGTNTDVTERLQLEGSLAKQNLALRRSNQELTQFAYVASHDMQEPLRTISNYTQLLERRHGTQFNDDAKKSFNVIVDSAQRMSKLITDLLVYSRISSETIDKEQDVELSTAVQDAKMMLAGPVRETGAELVVGSLPTVHGIRSRLAQLFMNLIGNSLKYRQAGVVPRITVSATLEGEFWRISVADNGQGFAPEYAERIFGIFKRLHGRDIPGTGIGLALCRSIVERMGGTIGAEGKLGEGSIFWFTIPR